MKKPTSLRLFPRSTWLSAPATRIVSIIGLSLYCAGCATTPRILVIPADKEVVRLPAAETYTPAVPGWFVPDARMQEILHQLTAKADE